MDIGQRLAQLEKRLEQVERSARLSHASLDDAAITVKDAAGTVRGAIGMQPDGTIGLVAVNGTAPGAPSAPLVTPAIGGLRVVWDGTLADGSTLPADFDHVAVHMSTTSGFTPSAATFVGTITRSGDGGMLPVTPLPYQAHYTVLIAVNTSGVASAPSAQTAATPLKVDGPDLVAGSVTASIIQAGAVTADKLEAILQLVTRIVAGDPNGARVELNEDGLRVYNSSNVLTIQFNSADGSAAFTGSITGSAITGSTFTGGSFKTATSGRRVTINETGTGRILIYDTSGTLVGELSETGVGVRGNNGAIVSINPDPDVPYMRWTNNAATKEARIQAFQNGTGDVNFEIVTSHFTAGGFTDWVWHQYLQNDSVTISRMRDDGVFATFQGGRLELMPTYGRLAFQNTIDATQACNFTIQDTLAYFSSARLQVLPTASSNSAFYVEVPAGHTGYLLRLFRSSDLFTVDKDGNVTAAGSMTAKNVDHGTVNAVMSAVASVDVTVTFNKTFPSAPHITASLVGNPTLPAGSSSLIARPFNVTTTGCQIRVNDTAGTARTLTHRVDWIARS
ncbi:hypothetical protein [Streptomyces longwoodensis]|uniref:hypothetical protein n=1 Tax=Streptomyces longwoodensis TaxID=68231 RepID=UPI0022526431|nr:hypothetical protein [Streptomyces longwoodensis]MCX5000981.1 hypothetical protein [Streptomyces longwoodensis]